MCLFDQTPIKQCINYDNDQDAVIITAIQKMNGGIIIVNMEGITQLHLINAGIMAVYVRGSFQRIMIQGGIEYVHALSCKDLQ